MKKLILAGLPLLALFLFSCKEKKKAESKGFVSVVSLVEKQVAHVDTSLYSIAVSYTHLDVYKRQTGEHLRAGSGG